ncbi:MAG: alpha/beta fold hydrolase [Paracoccaceae bacterium]
MRYEFSNCVLDTNTHSFFRDGEAQKIEPQVFDLLLLLLKNAGALVTKDQLVDEIWGGRIVSESAISARIAAARKAVGDDGKRQAIIRTVARRGLQFTAELIQKENPQPTSATPSQTPKIRYATADDGVKIAFAVSGNGPPLLRFAHHPTHLELEWTEPSERAMFDALGRKYTLIRMDQRGNGLSDLEIDEYSAERSAKDAKAVLETMGIDRVALLGTSSGAMIAVEFASIFPSSVSLMVTLGGYVHGRSVRGGNADSSSEDAIMNMVKAGWETPDSPFVSGFLAAYYPTASPEVLRQLANILQNSCPIENAIRGRDFFNNHSIEDLLAKVSAPTLVMHCRGDAVHPLSEGQKMARGIADAELLVLESRNHYPSPDEQSWHSMIAAMIEFIGN